MKKSNGIDDTYLKKCHNCKGSGHIDNQRVKDTECYYCRGKGWRNTHYGRDFK